LIIPHAHAKQRARAHGTFYHTLFAWRGVYRSDGRANYVRTDHRFLSRQRTDKKTIAAQGVVRSTNTIPIYSISFFCSLFKWQTNFFYKKYELFLIKNARTSRAAAVGQKRRTACSPISISIGL
jgi:hypothetical protein